MSDVLTITLCGLKIVLSVSLLEALRGNTHYAVYTFRLGKFHDLCCSSKMSEIVNIIGRLDLSHKLAFV